MEKAMIRVRASRWSFLWRATFADGSVDESRTGPLAAHTAQKGNPITLSIIGPRGPIVTLWPDGTALIVEGTLAVTRRLRVPKGASILRCAHHVRCDLVIGEEPELQESAQSVSWVIRRADGTHGCLVFEVDSKGRVRAATNVEGAHLES